MKRITTLLPLVFMTLIGYLKGIGLLPAHENPQIEMTQGIVSILNLEDGEIPSEEHGQVPAHENLQIEMPQDIVSMQNLKDGKMPSEGTGLVPAHKNLQIAMPQGVMSILNLEDGEIPSKADIGSGFLIARSQGFLGSCASFAVAEELTRALRIQNNWAVGRDDTFLSPPYLYNQVNHGQDNGSSFYDNLTLLQEKGCAFWSTFPYIMDYRMQPSEAVHREAARFKITEWKSVAVDRDAIRMWLAKGHGVMAGFKAYENLGNIGDDHIYRPSGGSNGYHGMLIMAYHDASRLFTVLNSWGTEFGDNGKLYFRYEDFTELVHEAYVLMPGPLQPIQLFPPSNVEASKGVYTDRIHIEWDNEETVAEYEVIRLGDNDAYISIGKTSKNFLDDTNAEPEKHYFYFVRSYTENKVSELSLVTEGWTSASKAHEPGIPQGLKAACQGNVVILEWIETDRADAYEVYRWNERTEGFILLGKTTAARYLDTAYKNGSSKTVSYFVIAKNKFGSSLPSDTAFVAIDDEFILPPDDRRDIPDEDMYDGTFYVFPLRHFRETEQQFKKNFMERQEQFRKKFQVQQDSYLEQFHNRQRTYNNNPGGKK
jgi:hypothetical protein